MKARPFIGPVLSSFCALLISSAAHGDTGNGFSPGEGSNEDRVLLLEQKLYTALSYIDEIRGELDDLKGGDSDSIGEARNGLWTPSATPRFRYAAATTGSGSEPELGGAEPAGGDQPPAESLLDSEEPSREQESPADLQAGFLRQARAVLISRGRLEIDPSLSFSHATRDRLLVRGIDIIEAVFIGDLNVSKVRRNNFNASWSLRYGLTDRIQLDVRVPYLRSYRQVLLRPEVQRELGEAAEETTSGGGLGDIEGTLSIHMIQEGEWLPDVILVGSVKSKTGASPFEIDPDREVATGTGFWGFRLGATMVKVSDPAVLFMSGGYFFHMKEKDVGPFDEVDPPDAIDGGVGFSYALNPFLSITTRFSARYSQKTKLNGFSIDGSDLMTASLGFGISYGLSGRTSLDIGADIGLTDDSPDFVIRVSTPMSFSLPRLWEN